MFWKSDKIRKKSTLINNIQEIRSYLSEKNISKKMVTMAASLIMLAGLLGVKYKSSSLAINTSAAAGGRELPIYCVQTDEPKIALTFDAAWGNSRLRQEYNQPLYMLKKINLERQPLTLRKDIQEWMSFFIYNY